MKKPMTDFVTRGGLGELLAAATAAHEDAGIMEDETLRERLRLAVKDGVEACELEASAEAEIPARAACRVCSQMYLVKAFGPRKKGFCSDKCQVEHGIIVKGLES